MEHEIAQDLLPLYHDGVCSEKSRAAVKEHLKGCEACRRALAEMDAPLPGTEKNDAHDAAVVKRISREWEKTKRRARVRSAVITALVCLALAGGWYGLTQWKIFPVPVEKMQITNVRQLKDGRVLYHFYIDDDLSLRYTRFEYDEQGNKYYVPLRALITEKRWKGSSAANADLILDVAEETAWAKSHGIQREITRVFYGRGEDAILLWEEGMDLPAASDADEAAYGCEPGSAGYWMERGA